MSTHAVVAIIGVGGMGVSIARRIACGRKVFLADFSEKNLQAAAEGLRSSGHDVETHVVDVSKCESVAAFAQAAASAGRIEAVVNSAGVSYIQASPMRVLEVDLLGTAIILDAFYEVATPGMSAVCLASMAGHMTGGLSAEFEQHLATAPVEKLLEHSEVQSATKMNAYPIAKRGNILRVQACSKKWGQKGARVNSISPGIIHTPMLEEELQGEMKDAINGLVEASAVARKGTSEEVANVVAFLVSRESSLISGTDILVDGGALAGSQWAQQASE